MWKALRTWITSIATTATMLAAPCAFATVDVTIVGDTAFAEISLDDGNGGTYDADVTILFDTPSGLTPESLNLTAEVVDPGNLALLARIPAGLTIDPDFPVLITVEPPDTDLLFGHGFADQESIGSDLSFLNNYAIEVHTHELAYVTDSTYRLGKAPLAGNFVDITDDVQSGSVRMRGRGGAFSQFIALDDARVPLVVALAKLTTLTTRTLAANIGGVLQADLLGLLTDVLAALVPLPNIGAAIAALDDFIESVENNAGTEIDNVWRARRDLVNDAGDLVSLARTLRFSLTDTQNRRGSNE